jgi:hypothetical protein
MAAPASKGNRLRQWDSRRTDQTIIPLPAMLQTIMTLTGS